MTPEFEVKVIKKDEQLDLSKGAPIYELKPIKLYVFESGSVDDKPSYAWHLISAERVHFIAQITHDMLMKGLVEVNAIK